MNAKADEYVAVFGITQEGETIADCSRKMAARVKEFTEALKALGIGDDDLFLDFVAQTKLYGFEMTGEIAREQLVGFELKKNLSVHFSDRDRLEDLVVAAARSEIHDLIKVDYIVKDADRIREMLMKEASRVIKRKSARYEELLGIKLQPPAQIYAERHATHYPSDLYDSYTAAETERISVPPGWDRSEIHHARKIQTHFFHGLDGNGFDHVINPIILEPVVQFTLYLKVKYEVEQSRAH